MTERGFARRLKLKTLSSVPPHSNADFVATQWNRIDEKTVFVEHGDHGQLKERLHNLGLDVKEIAGLAWISGTQNCGNWKLLDNLIYGLEINSVWLFAVTKEIHIKQRYKVLSFLIVEQFTLLVDHPNIKVPNNKDIIKVKRTIHFYRLQNTSNAL